MYKNMTMKPDSSKRKASFRFGRQFLERRQNGKFLHLKKEKLDLLSSRKINA